LQLYEQSGDVGFSVEGAEVGEHPGARAQEGGRERMVWRKRFRRARRVGSKSESGTRCRQSLLTPSAEIRVLRERWGYIIIFVGGVRWGTSRRPSSL
jgi:hypothetical protein